MTSVAVMDARMVKVAAEQAARDVARIMLRAVGLRRAVAVAARARAERAVNVAGGSVRR